MFIGGPGGTAKGLTQRGWGRRKPARRCLVAPKIDQLLDEAADALADGQPERALEKAEQALGQAPKDVEALGLRAAALTELGEWEQADAAYADLMKREPKEPTWVLAAADLFVRQPG